MKTKTSFTPGPRTSDCNDCGAKWRGASFTGVSLCPLHASAQELLKVAKIAEKFYVDELEAIGPCDHAVNICCCGIAADLESLREVVAKATGEVK